MSEHSLGIISPGTILIDGKPYDCDLTIRIQSDRSIKLSDAPRVAWIVIGDHLADYMDLPEPLPPADEVERNKQRQGFIDEAIQRAWVQLAVLSAADASLVESAFRSVCYTLAAEIEKIDQRLSPAEPDGAGKILVDTEELTALCTSVLSSALLSNQQIDDIDPIRRANEMLRKCRAEGATHGTQI